MGGKGCQAKRWNRRGFFTNEIEIEGFYASNMSLTYPFQVYLKEKIAFAGDTFKLVFKLIFDNIQNRWNGILQKVANSTQELNYWI